VLQLEPTPLFVHLLDPVQLLWIALLALLRVMAWLAQAAHLATDLGMAACGSLALLPLQVPLHLAPVLVELASKALNWRQFGLPMLVVSGLPV